ncbi:hypothetical protein ACTXT7_008671 [Hymenolepis weldensis]
MAAHDLSVNIFAEGILLPPSKQTPNATPRRHPLTSTLTCRLIQIASLRLCLHALLLQHIKNAVVTAAKMPLPSPIYEVLDTMTFDPAFIRAFPGHQTCVRHLLLFTPSSGKKATSSKCGGQEIKALQYTCDDLGGQPHWLKLVKKREWVLDTQVKHCQKRKPGKAKGGRRAAKRLCTDKSLFGEADGDGEDINVEDEDTNDGVGSGEGVESTTMMDVDTMAVTEQTTAMDKMAGAFSGGKCTILVNDITEIIIENFGEIFFQGKLLL